MISFKLKRLLSYIIFVSLLGSCGQSVDEIDSENESQVPPPDLFEFSFLTAHNPTLIEDIVLNFDTSNNTFSGVIPQNTSVKNLIATFQFSGTTVEVEGINQTSGKTGNDFTQILNYEVSNGLDVISYSIDVTRFTGLAVIEIETDDFLPIESRDIYVPAKLVTEGWRYHDSISEISIEIRGRGHSTWEWYPKKPYQIKFGSRESMLSMPGGRRWVLLAEYADKTMIRNKIAFEMSKLSNLLWTPSSEFFELFINREYQGTYNLVEKIELDSNRIDPGRVDYLLEIDQAERLDQSAPFFRSNFFLFHLKEPEVTKDSDELTTIKNKILAFEDAILDRRFSDNPDGYKSMIDVNSFVDWFLINEITKNIDAGTFYSSIYITISDDGKIALGPVWDFDLSMTGDHEGWWMSTNPWFEVLLLDPSFVHLMTTRFYHFYNNKTVIMDKIDEYRKFLDLASKQNDMKWQTIGTYIFPNPVYFETYDEEIIFLKNWINDRMDWLEQAISAL